MLVTQIVSGLKRCSSPELIELKLSSAGPTYIRDANQVITVPADAIAPNGAMSSAGTVLIINLV